MTPPGRQQGAAGAGGRYELEIAAAAERTLRKLDAPTRRRMLRALADLTSDPRPAGVIALTGYAGVLRHRVGHYRIVYEVHHDRLVVLVLDLGHRREIYRRW